MKKFVGLVLCVFMMTGLFAACGNQGDKTEQKNYTAEEIFNAIKEAYGETFIPDEDMYEEEYTETYGLNMDDVEDIKAQMALITFHPDRIVVVKAKEGKGADVEAALVKARQNLVDNGMWYPANLPKVNASKVVRNGDYVAFLIVGAIDENLEATEEEAAEFAEAEIQKGVDAFNALFE